MTVIGIGIALLIGGAVVTESVFAIPGLGRLVVDAILRRDYPIIQGVVLMFLVRLRARQFGGRHRLHDRRSEDTLLSSTIEVPLAATSVPHVTEAPVLPDILPPVKQRGRVITIVRRYPTMVIGGVLLLLILFVSVFAPFLWTVDPTALAPARRTRIPSGEYWFGSDMLGRDIYSRVLYGGRVSLIVGFAVALCSSVIGLLIGVVSGFVRWLDGFVMRIMDGLMSIPPILLAIALMALTRGSVGNVVTRHHGWPRSRAPPASCAAWC